MVARALVGFGIFVGLGFLCFMLREFSFGLLALLAVVAIVSAAGMAR